MLYYHKFLYFARNFIKSAIKIIIFFTNIYYKSRLLFAILSIIPTPIILNKRDDPP